MKDVDSRIRVQRDLRDLFQPVCRVQNGPAAKLLPGYMRSYVEEHDDTLMEEPAARSGPKSNGRQSDAKGQPDT